METDIVEQGLSWGLIGIEGNHPDTGESAGQENGT